MQVRGVKIEVFEFSLILFAIFNLLPINHKNSLLRQPFIFITQKKHYFFSRTSALFKPIFNHKLPRIMISN